MMLIPRVRPNYTLLDLIKASFLSESSHRYRTKVISCLKDIYGTDNIILTSSGRASIYWILKSLPQKKVLVPAYTCMVVVEAALIAGKNVGYVDTDYKSFNANDFTDADKDTIVIATHQYGMPCDIQKIVNYCHSKGAIVIEDCAAAFGTKIKDQNVGTFGDYGIFSFDPSKMITCPPKGGFIITKDKKGLDNLRSIYKIEKCSIKYKTLNLIEGVIYCILKNKIIYRIFHYLMMGRKGKMQLSDNVTPSMKISDFYKYGFYEWQASIVLRQLKEFDKIISKRKEVYAYYDRYIDNKKVRKPLINENAACIRYAIKVENKKDFYNSCIKQGVDMGFSFNHIAAPEGKYVEHMITKEILNVPYYYDISWSEVKKIVKVINNIR